MPFFILTSLVSINFSNIFVFLLFTSVIALAAIVSVNGPPYLCKTDEVGEICVSSYGTASSYWGLQGLTNTIFKVRIYLIKYLIKYNYWAVI